ncbi:MAG: hypothetical protein IPM86_00920 [Saprospiraceae bacterium]|nr:hypothetical protein [Saprospiraceae bacterium]
MEFPGQVGIQVDGKPCEHKTKEIFKPVLISAESKFNLAMSLQHQTCYILTRIHLTLKLLRLRVKQYGKKK